MDDDKPLISVIMPVYNVEAYIKESLDSILAQTISDFEFLIIDDCSTDATADILYEYKRNDERIKVLHNETNKGIVYSLNRGLRYARGTFVARMDGDDISMPERFEEQLKYLSVHEDVILCGTWTRNFGANVFEWHVDDTGDELKWRMLFRPVLAHPTFMMRKNLIEKYFLTYKENFYPAEDYEFAVNAAKYGNIGIVKKDLLRYRVHSNQISERNKVQQKRIMSVIRKVQAENLGIYLDEKVWHKIENVVDVTFPLSFKEIKEIYELLKTIYKKTLKNENSDCRYVIETEFIQYILHTKSLYYMTRGFFCELNMDERFIMIQMISRIMVNKLRRIQYL